jgi:hypothetical protein
MFRPSKFRTPMLGPPADPVQRHAEQWIAPHATAAERGERRP